MTSNTLIPFTNNLSFMKKIKYFYNTNTLRYEKLVTPLRVKLLRFFGFISALLVSSAIVIWLYTKFIPNPSDKQLKLKYDAIKDDYNNLNDELKTLQQQMAELDRSQVSARGPRHGNLSTSDLRGPCHSWRQLRARVIRERR